MSLAETKLIVSGIICFHCYYVEGFITKYEIEGNKFPFTGAYDIACSGRFLLEPGGLATLVLFTRNIVLGSMPILSNETWFL
jgi:hypothetical protein